MNCSELRRSPPTKAEATRAAAAPPWLPALAGRSCSSRRSPSAGDVGEHAARRRGRRRARDPARRDRPARTGQPPAAPGRGAGRRRLRRQPHRRAPPSPRRTRRSPPWTTRASSPPCATAARSSRCATATRRASTMVEVERAASPYPLTFRNHVMPVLTRVGCNSGPCHGALAGKSGFKLTLRGYDPGGRLPDADAAGHRAPRQPGRAGAKPDAAQADAGGVARRRQPVRHRVAGVSRALAVDCRRHARAVGVRPGDDRASKCSRRRRACKPGTSSRWSCAPASPTATPKT